MDTWLHLLDGFAVALLPLNLGYCFLGVLLGTLTGVLPGISALTAVAMLLPFTAGLPPTTAVVMLGGVYYGSEYGGAITAVLLNVPGTPAASISCQEGHTMARAGRAGQALIVSAMSSFGGGILGLVAILLLSPVLVDLAFGFGPAEYFAAMLFALVATAVVQHGHPLKGVSMVLLGMSLALVGTDMQTGVPRFTAGWLELRDGIPVAVLAMGLFGVSEVMHSLLQSSPSLLAQRMQWWPNRSEWLRSAGPTLRGGLIGSLLGALPGTGTTASTVIAYTTEKLLSPRSRDFGQGMVEGLAAPESANNAAAQTAFIPTLMLGIPGSATMALMLGALNMHGMTPSPLLPVEQPQFFWGLVASFVVGNVMLLVLNIPLIGVWIRLLSIPPRALYPLVLALIIMSVYSSSGNLFGIFMVAVIGFLGFMLRWAEFPLSPLLIGFVLEPMVEENMRRALAISQGELGILVGSPVSAGLLACTAMLLLFVSWRRWHLRTI